MCEAVEKNYPLEAASAVLSHRKALDAEVFSELAQILKGAEAESATVPRMIQELGHVLRESPQKDEFLDMTIE
ncbi:hypothetical protein MTO96_037254, partial [Rhipicephalus appendiculatus]